MQLRLDQTMPKDRLTDLRVSLLVIFLNQVNSKPNKLLILVSLKSNVVYDVDQVSISIASSNGFFDDANKIRADIETLHQNIGMVERLQGRIVNSSGSEETRMILLLSI